MHSKHTLIIYRFSVSTSETWRMWPRVKSLSELVQLGDDKSCIDKVLSIYTKRLYGDLYDAELQMRSAVTAVADSLENLHLLLKDFHQTSEVNKNFIL